MVTTLYLIRHGATLGGDVKRYKGSIDVRLSAKGVQQIKRVSKFIVHDSLKRLRIVQNNSSSNAADQLSIHEQSGLASVYSSPLSRALACAEIVAEPHRLKPLIVNDLRERSFGMWEGMTFLEIKAKYPFEFEAWANNPIKYSPVGGESTIEVRDRVVAALKIIMDNHSAQQRDQRVLQTAARKIPLRATSREGDERLGAENIAIVAHGGVNRVLLCHLMGIPLENIFRIEQDNAAVNIIEFWDGYPVIKLLNGTA
ncbi:MAG: histidine phosphatase family protein [Dissulfurispiraceae bacterium]